MAQEITATTSLSVSLSGQTASGSTTFKLDLTGDYLGEEQTIGTTSEQLDFGDLTLPQAVYVRNLDTTNYVEIDSATTMDKFPQKVYPGTAILLLPQTGTIYAKANTASVKIWFVAG